MPKIDPSRKLVKIATTIAKEDYERLRKLSQLTGRPATGLLKWGIWEILKEEEEAVSKIP